MYLLKLTGNNMRRCSGEDHIIGFHSERCRRLCVNRCNSAHRQGNGFSDSITQGEFSHTVNHIHLHTLGAVGKGCQAINCYCNFVAGCYGRVINIQCGHTVTVTIHELQAHNRFFALLKLIHITVVDIFHTDLYESPGRCFTVNHDDRHAVDRHGITGLIGIVIVTTGQCKAIVLG